MDTYLEGIVSPLARKLRSCALHVPSASSSDPVAHAEDTLLVLQSVIHVSRLLVVVVCVRGYKTVAHFLPHEAMDLERVVSLIQAVKDTESSLGGVGVERGGKGGGATFRPSDANRLSAKPSPLTNTARSGSIIGGKTLVLPEVELAMVSEAQAMLMLWLSVLVLLPFHMATLDSRALEASGGFGFGQCPPLVKTVLKLCLESLHQPGAVRDMAALVLGRLLTRPDMEQVLWRFITGRSISVNVSAYSETGNTPAATTNASSFDDLPNIATALAKVDDLQAPFLYPGEWRGKRGGKRGEREGGREERKEGCS